MKKLMILAAIVCAATMSNAAIVNWGAAGTKTQGGITVYLLNSMDSSYASIAAFQATAIDSGTLVAGTKNAAFSKTLESAAVTKSANYYCAIIENDTTIRYIDATKDMQVLVYGSQDPDPGKYTAKVADILVGSTATIKGGGDVPEPTSAMLLLLGVAGLALRRKQK